VRPGYLVAGAALTAALALVALPGLVGSQTPSRDRPLEAAAFQAVTVLATQGGSSATIARLDDPRRSANVMSVDATFQELGARTVKAVVRPKVYQPASAAKYSIKPARYTLKGTATFYDNGTTAMRLPRARSSGSAGPAVVSNGSSTTTAHGRHEPIIDLTVLTSSPCGCPSYSGTATVTVGVYLAAVSFRRPFNDRSREAGRSPQRATAHRAGDGPMNGRTIMTADDPSGDHAHLP
jgi:hypothetical protein